LAIDLKTKEKKALKIIPIERYQAAVYEHRISKDMVHPNIIPIESWFGTDLT
jgi:hypothetical protein